MRRVIFALLLVACADPPTATLVFAPLGDPDNCAESETEIVGGTSALWIGMRQEGVTLESSCVAVDGATGWLDLEDALVHAGELAADLPLGAPFRPFVMGLPDPCTGAEPTGGIRFCARADGDVIIDADDGGGTIQVQRICPATWSAQDCFDE